MKDSLQNKGALPRLAMINDLTGFGRCSLAVAIPVVSMMQVQACPIPTSILSNHLGFSSCYFHDYTSHMAGYLKGLSDLNIHFDGISCGFLGNAEQIAIVEGFLNTLPNTPLFLLDPVMGDHGKTYSTITGEHCQSLKGLVHHAQILTPNITEACLLTDTLYKKDGFSIKELEAICRKLDPDSQKKIVITGLPLKGSIRNYIWENGSDSCYDVPITGSSRPGTGDLFASILAGDALNNVPFADSVGKAADFIALCIDGTEASDTPVLEGVLFEKYLYRLLPS